MPIRMSIATVRSRETRLVNRLGMTPLHVRRVNRASVATRIVNSRPGSAKALLDANSVGTLMRPLRPVRSDGPTLPYQHWNAQQRSEEVESPEVPPMHREQHLSGDHQDRETRRDAQ